MKLRFALPLFAALALVVPAVHAQKPAPPTPAPAKAPVKKAKGGYVCDVCKMSFSHNAAKQLNMKDAKGHAIKKVTTVPDDYKKVNVGDLRKDGSLPAKEKKPRKGAKPAPTPTPAPGR